MLNPQSGGCRFFKAFLSCLKVVHFYVTETNGYNIMKKLLATAVAGLISVGSFASAATFTINNGTYGDIPGVSQAITPQNDVLNALGLGTLGPDVNGDGVADRSLGGYFGADIALNLDTQLKIELIGYEAGNLNTFNMLGQSVSGGQNANNVVTGNPLSFVVTAQALTGLLGFDFTSLSASGATGSVANGGNPTQQFGSMNFFASFGPGAEADTTGDVLWLFLDDIGQTGGDNHDDLVVRISAVPLPAGMVLMLTGMGALALRRKRTS